jgi:solute:Na+ symporter, SSS family
LFPIDDFIHEESFSVSIYSKNPFASRGMDFHENFTTIDWCVVAGYLLLTTLVGHLLRGKQANIKDFFLGGRSLPWLAVTGSIIATEISGVTFIGVPGMVYAAGGDFTYLQWGIGSIIARIIVGIFFVRAFYEKEIYSPYDFMGNRLGIGAKRLATIIFQIGGILGQSVRVLVAALALKVVTPLEFHECIWIIGIFAVGWTLMGGMRTVIWTDVMQFFLFVGAGLLSLAWMISSIEGGWTGMVDVADQSGKFTLFNLTSDPAVGFTLWVAILAVPFQNLSAFGVDQLNAQRMFCCKNSSDARKAMITSSAALLLTTLMLVIGAALFAYYEPMRVSGTEPTIFSQDSNYIYPVWIVTELPVGLRGLILAGIFAAAISSLDSILAALSQTTLSLFKTQDSDPGNEKKNLLHSRLLVLFWGIALSAFAIQLNSLRGNVNVVNLAFGMISYTTGPMLGMFLAALFTPRARTAGLALGFALSFLLVAYIRPDFYQILINFDIISAQDAATWNGLSEENGILKPHLHSAWAWPITVFLTWGCGLLFAKKAKI